jgi:hypothetical protein
MPDGSEMMIYLLYVLLIIVLAIACWYMGMKYTMPYVGAGVGVLIGAGVVYGIKSQNQQNSYRFY